MIEMELNKIIIDEKRQDQMIVLKEKKGKKMLPIVIGFIEATAIKMKISGIKPARPLTHDLLANLITSFGAKVTKVVIDKLEDSTFFAKLVIQAPGRSPEILVDARPSDCIALAVRLKAPIFVEEDVIRLSETFHHDIG